MGTKGGVLASKGSSATKQRHIPTDTCNTQWHVSYSHRLGRTANPSSLEIIRDWNEPRSQCLVARRAL
eukprot:2685344-Karenia_brevis.AAC.1